MTADEQAQIVTFALGSDHFSADVLVVERVLRYQSPRAVPNVPAWVAGVIAYGGRVVPVIDLRARFGLPPAARAEASRTLVFVVGGEWIAVVVDAVLDVTPLRAGELEPPPAIFRGLAGEYLRGLVRRHERLTIVLDVDRLLSSTEQLELREALAEHDPEDAPAGV
jgi:purine-binding chemotaxis protein CheW